MTIDRVDVDPWALFIAITAFFAAMWISRSVVATHRVRRAALQELILLAVVSALGGSVIYGVTAMLPPLLSFLVVSGALFVLARNLSVPGIAWLSISFIGVIVGWVWACLLIDALHLPHALKVLALLGTSATLAISILSTVERIAREAVLTHSRWRLPTRALPVADEAAAMTFHPPLVSIHLPCYAEPPEIVMETMNRLAALDYSNYEVLVCDNNTRDEALWRPLERHVATLNQRLGQDRFRFFHVAPLEGAKAGALNFLIGQCAPQTDLVAVVDADYYAEPDFLARLVPFFRNPSIAYVQTPHDYRDFAESSYLSGCYSEYMPNNKIDMLGVHEYGGAFTIGTMCILRFDALKAVGGWAEWCLTEDSEVSVRLRAAGYHGIYVGETFGRGLIPATFDDYKKQRFRWTAGPVQQLVRHWRLFLPAPWARRMPGWTKILEFARCVAPIQTLLQLATGLVLVVGAVIGTATGLFPPIVLPPIVWGLMGLAAATSLVRTWHRYRLAGIDRVTDMIRGEIARSALLYIVLVGGIAGLSNKPLAWRRTPKFGEGDSVAGALSSVVPEIIAGTLSLAAALLLILGHGLLGWSFAGLSAFGMAAMGARFLCAPYMALIALRDAAPIDAVSTEPANARLDFTLAPAE